VLIFPKEEKSMLKLKATMLGVGACALAFFCGCILSPDQDKNGGGGGGTPIYKDLTQKEDPIDNLMTSYNNANIQEYEKLLHPDYLFYNQTADVAQGLPEFLTKDTDVRETTNMFAAARGQYKNAAQNLDALTLEITPASWMSLDTVPGLPAPCVDCWATTRQYLVNAVLTGGQTTLRGNDLVQIIVVPVEENGKKLYKLYRVEDISSH
jgi:hypothetical protein